MTSRHQWHIVEVAKTHPRRKSKDDVLEADAFSFKRIQRDDGIFGEGSPSIREQVVVWFLTRVPHHDVHVEVKGSIHVLRHVQIDEVAKMMKHVDPGVEFDEEGRLGDSDVASLLRFGRFELQRSEFLEFREPRLERRFVAGIRGQQLRIQGTGPTNLSLGEGIFSKSINIHSGSAIV